MKVKEFYAASNYAPVSYQRIALYYSILQDEPLPAKRPDWECLLTLYHEYTATFNRLNKEEQTIIKRQFINKERVNNVMNDMGLKPSAYRRRQLSARQKLAAGLNTSPCFHSLEITFTA